MYLCIHFLLVQLQTWIFVLRKISCFKAYVCLYTYTYAFFLRERDINKLINKNNFGCSHTYHHIIQRWIYIIDTIEEVSILRELHQKRSSTYMCVCICICVCMYTTCVCIHTYIHTYKHIYIYTHYLKFLRRALIHTCVYVCMYVHIHIYTYYLNFLRRALIRTCVCIYTYTYIYTY
jgi:hypothetical protein